MIINFLAIYGALCLLGMLLTVVVFGPGTYRYIRGEFRGKQAPAWAYRLRRWVASRAEDLGGLLFILAVAGLTWLGLVVTAP